MIHAKIAIVEDDHRYSDCIAELIRSVGYEVLVCRTEKELEQIATFAPDVVLMDHDLGFSTGDTVAKFLKLPKSKLVSISNGTCDLSYCQCGWSKKSIFDLSPSESERQIVCKNLLDMIEKVATSV